MTFSIAGRCERTGMLGIAITTSSICVGARCPWVRAGVGAVASQNITDPSLGPALLDMLGDGIAPANAIKQVRTIRENIEYRQLTVIDAAGVTASFTGTKTLGTHAVAEGVDCVAAGNLLANEDVPGAMTRAFADGSDTHLGERLLRSLEAGVIAGDEMGPVHSACLLVAHDQSWPLIDLRVDWDEDSPLGQLRDIWQRYEPEMNSYVVRALNPSSAPAFGVPGDT
ncbi:MAG: DUF1028 domain-containing protein [Hyphomicrobiales bacterium]|nr:DUF1028 domain-containing protein [Hyphomicrobiales bacterium]